MSHHPTATQSEYGRVATMCDVINHCGTCCLLACTLQEVRHNMYAGMRIAISFLKTCLVKALKDEWHWKFWRKQIFLWKKKKIFTAHFVFSQTIYAMKCSVKTLQKVVVFIITRPRYGIQQPSSTMISVSLSVFTFIRKTEGIFMLFCMVILIARPNIVCSEKYVQKVKEITAHKIWHIQFVTFDTFILLHTLKSQPRLPQIVEHLNTI